MYEVEMALIKKLTKQGNSYSLILDKPLMELLDINSETPLELSTKDGQSLVITPLREEALREVDRRNLERFQKKYGNTLKRLAE